MVAWLCIHEIFNLLIENKIKLPTSIFATGKKEKQQKLSPKKKKKILKRKRKKGEYTNIQLQSMADEKSKVSYSF